MFRIGYTFSKSYFLVVDLKILSLRELDSKIQLLSLNSSNRGCLVIYENVQNVILNPGSIHVQGPDEYIN